MSLAERKVMASIQRRRGPNVVGFFGILQPFADGIKLFLKEFTIPLNANKVLFTCAPIFSFAISLILWCIIPTPYNNFLYSSYDSQLEILYILSISSLGVYA